MTTPTLEKAAAVIEKIERDGYRFLDHLSGYDESTLIGYIAAAIREAENAALERAQRELAMTIMANIDEGEPEFINGLSIARDRIETLKRPKD